MKKYSTLSEDSLNELFSSAISVERMRQHHNLHSSADESVQRLFNAMHYGTYLQPHSHPAMAGVETLLVISGCCGFVEFSDDGSIRATEVLMGNKEDYPCRPTTSIIEISPSCWHTILCLSPKALIFEVKAGPFVDEKAKLFAPWAPREGAKDSIHYRNDLESELIARHYDYS